MAVVIDGTTGISTPAEAVAGNLSYTGTLTGGAGVINLGSGQFYKDASGNVGIGGAATNDGGYGRCLQVTGTEAALELKSGSDFSYVAQNGTTLQIKNNATAGVMTFATEATERARIDSSGNLLVGTTSVLGASAAGTTHINGGTNNSEEAPLYLRNQFSTAGRYWKVGPTNNGGFIIFNASATGQYMTYGATAWSATSDERLKTAIVPFENAANKVSSLRAGTGRYLTDSETVSRSFLSAQSVLAVLPEAVDEQEDEMKTLGLRYTDVIPLLVAAIQEQQTLIVSLQDTLTALNERLTALEAANV